MQEGAASESSPRDAHVVQGFGSGPLLKGLLADSKQHSATTLALLGAHDMHAPLVLDAGGIRARPAQMIAVEVRQVVVVALDTLDQLPTQEPRATACAGVEPYGATMILSRWVRRCARLCSVHWGPFPLGRGPGGCRLAGPF